MIIVHTQLNNTKTYCQSLQILFGLHLSVTIS